MYKLYCITNNVSGTKYFGITKRSLASRFAGHRHCCKVGKKTKLYDAMRKYGVDCFSINTIAEFSSQEACCAAEIAIIQSSKDSGIKIYNLADGGEGGYVVPEADKEAWKTKLKAARAGRKPALGMQHTEENKKKFGNYGKLRWDIYGRYPDDVVEYSFQEAHKLFGISKTHYYRLLKRAKNNDLR